MYFLSHKEAAMDNDTSSMETLNRSLEEAVGVIIAREPRKPKGQGKGEEDKKK